MSYDPTQPTPSPLTPTPVDLTMPPSPPSIPYSQTTKLVQITRVLVVGAISLLLLFSFLALGLGPH